MVHLLAEEVPGQLRIIHGGIDATPPDHIVSPAEEAFGHARRAQTILGSLEDKIHRKHHGV